MRPVGVLHPLLVSSTFVLAVAGSAMAAEALPRLPIGLAQAQVADSPSPGAADRRGPDQPAQATPEPELPWHFQALDQAGGSTGPVVVAGDLAYVGRGPVVAVADISDPRQPRWVGQSEVLDGQVTDLVMVQGHLLATVGVEDYEEDLVALSLRQSQSPRLSGRLDLPTASLGLAASSAGQAWLTVVDHSQWGRVGWRDYLSIVSLGLDSSGAPMGEEVWRAEKTNGSRIPAPAPALRPLGDSDLLVTGLEDADSWDRAVWNFSLADGGRLRAKARVGSNDRTSSTPASYSLALDPQQRRAYAALGSTLTVVDILSDGTLRERGSLELPDSERCRGLLWTGRWLIASSTCDASPSVTLIDPTDPDRPRVAAQLTLPHPVAHLALAGDRLVATGGLDGGLTLLQTHPQAALTELGHLAAVPAYGHVVQVAAGRFGAAPGVGIVRIAEPIDRNWAQPLVVYPLTGISDLAASPDGRLLATENTRPAPLRGPAQLHVLIPDAAGLRLEQRVALDAEYAGNLLVAGRDLYLGQGGNWQPGAVQSPVLRWRAEAGKLTLQARADPKVAGSCFGLGDKLYVVSGNGIVALDPSSLIPLQVLASDRHRNGNVCSLPVRSLDGKAPLLFGSGNDGLLVQKVEAGKLVTIGHLEHPAPSKFWQSTVTDRALWDVAGNIVALGLGGMELIDARSETQLRRLAYLSMPGLTGFTTPGSVNDLWPLDAAAPSLNPGRHWVLSSSELGMIRFTTVASPAIEAPAGPTPRPWQPTEAQPRPQPSMPAPKPGPRVYLPLVADHEGIRMPGSFAEQRSLALSYRAIAAEADRVWAADGHTVALLATDGQTARMLDRSEMLPIAPTLLAAAPGLILAAEGRGLVVLTRDPELAPTMVGQLDLPDRVLDLVVFERMAYAATAFCGIVAIDLSQPTRPRITSILDTPSPSQDLLLVDGWLLSVEKTEGDRRPVRVASLADRDLPRWVGLHKIKDFDHAASDGRQLFTDARSGESAITALTPGSDGALVEDSRWTGAMAAAPGAGLTMGRQGPMVAGKGWLLVAGYRAIDVVALDAAGLPEKVTRWQLGGELDFLALALDSDSAWGLIKGNTAGSAVAAPSEQADYTWGSLLWLHLGSVSSGSPDSRAARHAWFADALPNARRMLRVGTTLLVGQGGRDKGIDVSGTWLALDATDPSRIEPLGRLQLSDGVHWMSPGVDDTTALALRWRGEQMGGSILRLDLSESPRVRVLAELPLPDRYPASATRSGPLVAVSLEPPDSTGDGRLTYLIVADEAGKPLSTLGTIASDPVGHCYEGSLFIDRSRGFLSTTCMVFPGGSDSIQTRVRTEVYDLGGFPPNKLGELPFAASALRRIGDEVFALLPPIPDSGTYAARLAVITLSDSPAASSIRQDIDLDGAYPLNDEPGLVLGEIAALPDGSLIWPVLSTSDPRRGTLLQHLRRVGPTGTWQAEPGLRLDLEGFGLPSLSNVNGWLAFLGDDGNYGRSSLLQLIRLAP